MKGNKSGRQITITGIVTPTDWDNDGNTIAVAISTPLEDEYLVDADTMGRELLELVGEKVIATGIVTEDEYWNKRIAVAKYELLGGEDEDELADEEKYGDLEDDEDDEHEEDEKQDEE